MDVQTFCRMTFSERGHFPNTLRLWPVTEVATDRDGIALTRRGERRRYRWSDIRRARIWNQEIYKGYGAYASSMMIRRTFEILTVDGRRHVFDVSGDFPDFKNTPQLLRILNSNLVITESPIKRFNHALWISVIAALLVLGVLSKRLGF